MKTNFNANRFSVRVLFSVLFLIGLFVLGCENQQVTKPVSKEEIQKQILADEEFMSMMTNIFVVNFSGVAESKTSEAWKEHLKVFGAHFATLDDQYPDFHVNAQEALSKTTSSDYITFANKLNDRIRAELGTESAKLNYDGPGVCGHPCGNNEAITTSCITGCYYSSTYCYEHGGTDCAGMLDSCKASCCEAFCPGGPPAKIGH